MPRPFKLTMEISQTIIEAMRRGNYLMTAAKLAGVNDDTVRNWLKRGEELLARGAPYTDDEQIFMAFTLAFDRVNAEVEDESVTVLRTGKDSRGKIADRKGHLKFLERRFPDRWGNRKAIEHTGSLELNHHAKVVVIPGISGPIDDSVETQSGTTDAVSPEQRK